VIDAHWIAPVTEGAGKTAGNAKPALCFAQQQQATVG
jgi:hypothetical protein